MLGSRGPLPRYHTRPQRLKYQGWEGEGVVGQAYPALGPGGRCLTELSEREILDLIAGGESDRIEFKEDLSGKAPKGIMEAICAFANDLPDYGKPGYVFVGVRDDGTLAGIQVGDETLLALANMRYNGQIGPVPTMTVQRVDLQGKQVAMVTVQPSRSPPVRYKGSILVGTGPRRGLASAQDEGILNEKRRKLDTGYEMHPMSRASLEDLSDKWFTEYLAKAFSSEALEANNRSHEERLAALKMIDSANNPVPTVMGLLTIGKDPQFFLPSAYVQFLKFEGEEMSDEISDGLEILGPIQAITEHLDIKFLAHNRVAVEIGSQVEKRATLYPMEALRELTRNAIMHRDYEDSTPIRVHWFRNRIEIINPGGAYGGAAGRLGEPGATGYRNLSLAAAMRDMGLVQRYGVGIQVAQRALQAGGNPPLDLREDGAFVWATIYSSPAYGEAIARHIYKYHFMVGDRVVYAGITNDLERRESEHRQRPGWERGYISQVGGAAGREEALQWEAEQKARGIPTGY